MPFSGRSMLGGRRRGAESEQHSATSCDLPEPQAGGESGPVVAEVDVNLAFCIGGALPGEHRLFVALKTPGVPLETPPAQRVQWEEGILFQRWIKTFRIPVQAPGEHSAAILFDGIPLGEASFLVRFQPQ